MGLPSFPLVPQALEKLSLNTDPVPLRKLLPVLRVFPRLKQLMLEEDGDCDITTAELRQMPALENVDVFNFGSMSLSEPLLRLTCLRVTNGHQLEVGAAVTLPSLRCLISMAVGTALLGQPAAAH